MTACTCPQGEGFRDWSPWCPAHGIEARIAAGVWPARLRDLWNTARCQAARPA